MKLKDYLLLALVSLIGAFAFSVIALSRGERIGALWILIAAFCIYFMGYRFYSYFVAYKVFEINDQNITPAHRYYNKLDYVPTNKWVLFGHHFASISGAGPLVGPVLCRTDGIPTGDSMDPHRCSACRVRSGYGDTHNLYAQRG